jgi:hypothetical protein
MNFSSVHHPSGSQDHAGVRVYDPSGSVVAEKQSLAARTPALDGLRLSILDNTKWNAMTLLRKTAELLQERAQFAQVRYFRKEAFSKPASQELLQQIAAESDIVLTAIGDCGSCTSCCTVDAIEFERLGIPTAIIVTTEFVHESNMQALAMGVEDLKPIVIDHPLSALTNDLIVQRAQQAAPQAEAIWKGIPSSRAEVPATTHPKS